ncbi:dTMP kinase [Dehalococcoides mccartyi]|jgi:dTMP kinase|uniref:Thymidylate kinase n=2 Tax=Dehalococcoides mccartyi TaxID=61435 RepID=KTHY_DEHMC|nr:dTMP kinase [Dehalococcoides mccartyi]Q3ZXD8.1 RecName: Full=Thymidylate kinase; AltName: Full=dTMP kinase [Dehalococcoides mccartyi CBDB1]AII60825.1 thymidylate kinase [Dehalococcoides mccartyi CG5]AMU86498.1 thymidylate kinase [Dehalococcoides mccartyi]AOV99323.1 thymidylate kinase [Dehalococcoides mccartyi]AQX73160.1 thymidylate kinase [Dehalococcoides mccartyi]MBA2085109.1 Thymidylate kinase [Dehalococcoides mccartyi]
MSLFITFEGGEGCGKSTQSKALYRYLKKLGLGCVLTHEPGGSKSGDKITRLLKWSKEEHISPLTELLLFNASRSILIDNVIKPALQDGKIVICDRYTDSTLAYQGYGRGLDLDTVKCVNSLASGGLVPDLTIWLDMDDKAALLRKGELPPDRFESENNGFHQRVRNGFGAIYATEPDRFLKLDASLPQSEIFSRIKQRVTILLGCRNE